MYRSSQRDPPSYSNAYSSSRSNYENTANSTTASSSYNRDQLLEDIPDYGSAFVCGKSRFEEGKFHVRDDPILQISCGDEHTGVVTEKGRVFMFGSNNWGQLGLGHENNIDKPSCVKSVKHEKIRLIACGRYHTLLATERGNLYSFGCNSDGQLGLGKEASKSFYSLPVRIESIDPDDWLMIAAGSSQSAALSRSGDLFVWGGNENGEIGMGKVNEQHYPKLVSFDSPIGFVACGYYHTAVITKKGRVYTCGSNENSQLGHAKDPRRFNEVEGLDEPIRIVSCGGHHTVLVSTNGKVYTMGDGSRGQLGHGEDVQKCKRPELVSFFKKKIVVQVSAGECQTAFVTDTNEIFTCGDNRHGKLGLDQKKFNSIQFYPHLVEKYRQLKVINVACGGCHMILIGKLRGNIDSFDDRSDEGFDERRNYDRRNKDYSSPRKPSSSRQNYSPHRGRRGSDSDFDEENERTFNRTHTLTRDHGFVPLSDLNLKKLANDDKLKSSSKNLRSLNEPYSRGNDRNRNSARRYDSDSDSPFSSNNKNDNLKVVPYVKPGAGSSMGGSNRMLSSSNNNAYDTNKPFSKYNLRTLSDDESDYGPKSSNYSRPVGSSTAAVAASGRKIKNLSDSSDEDYNKGRMSSRSAQVRRNTKTLNDSDLRATSKSVGSTSKNDEKPKDKPFKICTIL